MPVGEPSEATPGSQPVDVFSDVGEGRGTSKQIREDVKKILWTHRKRLAAGFLFLVIGRLASLVLPASSKYLVDEVLAKGSGEMLLPLAGAIIAATVVQASVSLALSRVLGLAAQRAIMDVRKSLEQKVLRLPVHLFDSTRSGVLISRIMTDPSGLRNLLGTGLVQLSSSALTATFALAALIYLNWRLTIINIAVLMLFGLVMARAFKYLRPLFRQRGELNAQLTARLTESLAGVRIVKAYGAEKHEDRVFAQGIHKLFRSIAREVTASATVGAIAIVIFGCLSALMVLLGGRAILSGTMTLGDFVMYVFFVGLLLAPVVRMADTGTQMTEAFAGLDRIRQVLEQPTEDERDESREPLARPPGEVEFREVEFEYTRGVPVLRGVSFRAAPGSTTALVGSSGAGKSTVIGLVMGFQYPTRGDVLVDGRDLTTIRRRDYRSHLGVVLQENFLFAGTIAENIAYARRTASREEIVAASRTAHCHEFIESFPNGYDTLVGERGIRLSGGQRQRVAIARAVLADPRILILDEATSSLDSESEALIQDGLHSLRRGRTTFVIAHRLSTIQSADQILVMEGGLIVERGTHEELLAKKGRYRQLHDRQYHLEINRFVNPGEAPAESGGDAEGGVGSGDEGPDGALSPIGSLWKPGDDRS